MHSNETMSEQHVFVVDDDSGVREAIECSLRSLGLSVRAFGSADAFLAGYRPGDRGCLILDVEMPGRSGMDLQTMLLDRGIELPIIFLSGHGTVSMCVRALKRGAVDFIEKPCDEDRLLESIHGALEKDRRQHEAARQQAAYEERYALLTDREKEVMELLIAGRETKSIAVRLGIVARTVDNHRAAVFEKMQVDNAAALTRMVLTYGQASPIE